MVFLNEAIFASALYEDGSHVIRVSDDKEQCLVLDSGNWSMTSMAVANTSANTLARLGHSAPYPPRSVSSALGLHVLALTCGVCLIET